MISLLRALVLIASNTSRLIPFRGVASLPQKWRAEPLWAKLLWNAFIMVVMWLLSLIICLIFYGNDNSPPAWWQMFSWFSLTWCIINPALAGLTHKIDKTKT